MMTFSLYDRFMQQGTLSEPDGIPDPRFALPSTVHWMRSLALRIEDAEFDFQAASTFYNAVPKTNLKEREINSIFEHLLLGLHQLSALRAMLDIKPQADIVRVASVAWYYGIYASTTAMVAAQDGSLQDNHTRTANSWDRQFAAAQKVMHPFDLRVSTLVKKEGEKEIDAIRRGPRSNLVQAPKTADEARQYLCSYLSGTRGWWAWRKEEEVRSSREFEELGVSNFRTKAAQEMRDNRLRKQAISFTHQAIRFRGKANYREALYLAHGNGVESTITGFVADMAVVLEAFLMMAGIFSFARIGDPLSRNFLDDLDQYRSFSIDPRGIWRFQ